MLIRKNSVLEPKRFPKNFKESLGIPAVITVTLSQKL